MASLPQSLPSSKYNGHFFTLPLRKTCMRWLTRSNPQLLPPLLSNNNYMHLTTTMQHHHHADQQQSSSSYKFGLCSHLAASQNTWAASSSCLSLFFFSASESECSGGWRWLKPPPDRAMFLKWAQVHSISGPVSSRQLRQNYSSLGLFMHSEYP